MKITINKFIYLIVLIELLQALTYSQSNNNIHLSIKGSFHTSDNPNSFEGFNQGYFIGGNCDFALNKNVYFSANILFGKSTDNSFIAYPNYLISREYVFWGIDGLIKYKEKIDKIGISIGIGLGNLNLKTSSVFGKDIDSYLDFRSEIGISYFILKDIYIEFGISNFQFANYNKNTICFYSVWVQQLF